MMPPEPSPYDSLVALRADHDALLREEPALDAPSDAYKERVRTFLLKASTTGRYLYPLDERRPIQSMLTYWATFLIRFKVRAEGNLLEPFDPEAARERVRIARKLGPDAAMNPYQSLAPFGEQDAAFFFGRSQIGNEAIQRLRNARVLLIAGPSGGGKSSLARAGVIPLLKAGAIEGSAAWCYPEPFVPGNAPVQALLDAVWPCGGRDDDPGRLASTLSQPVVLLVDQFEELFLIGVPEGQRKEFIATLKSLAESDLDHRIVLTMRSDSMEYLERYEDLIRSGVEILSIAPMTANELRASIEAPAAMLGVRYESTVVDAIVREFQGEPAALPLLQFVLTRLWQIHERKGGNVITEGDLQEVGPPGEALGKVAQACLADLSADGVKHMRLVMFALLQPGLGQLVHRRRARRKELWDIGPRVEIDQLVDRLKREGLVRVVPGGKSEDDVVEVTHESVLQSWPELQSWIRERREKVPRRLLITESARQWKATKDSVYLLSGSLLEEAEKADDLSEDEKALIAQSSRKTKIVRSSYAGYVAILIALFSIIAYYKSSQQVNTNKAINAALLEQRLSLSAEKDKLNSEIEDLKREKEGLIRAKAAIQSELNTANRVAKSATSVLSRQTSILFERSNLKPDEFESSLPAMALKTSELARVYIQTPVASKTQADALRTALASRQILTPGIEVVSDRSSPRKDAELRGRDQDYRNDEYIRVTTVLDAIGVKTRWRKFPPAVEQRALPNRFEIWLPASFTQTAFQ